MAPEAQLFTAPAWFSLLIVVAGLAVAYLFVQRRKRKHVLRFANLDLLDRVAPRRPGALRHVSAVLSLVALILFAVGLAGPTAQAQVPRDRATVMLVLDESLSMGATDIAPSRLDAVKAAATDFVRGVARSGEPRPGHLRGHGDRTGHPDHVARADVAGNRADEAA